MFYREGGEPGAGISLVLLGLGEDGHHDAQEKQAREDGTHLG